MENMRSSRTVSICINISFDAKNDEFLTMVSGSYNSCYITSLKFDTNLGTYGPFGTFNADCPFHFGCGNDPVVFGGFHGTADIFGLRSIGINIFPRMTIEQSAEKISQ
ncbi:hypothetical protein Tsubulata_026879, partial [Turnera subulata]